MLLEVIKMAAVLIPVSERQPFPPAAYSRIASFSTYFDVPRGWRHRKCGELGRCGIVSYILQCSSKCLKMASMLLPVSEL